MAVINRIAGLADEMAAWRRHLHAHPELSFDCHETAAFVAARLREFGVDEVHEGIAQSGVVAVIRGRGEGPAIGLRADMDALPMDDLSGTDHVSTVPGRAHACGHDGHTAMLLGAAKYLAETRNFAGTAVLLFQPAEEDGGGGNVMVQEGVMERFGIEQVYGLHNGPGLPEGSFNGRPGPLMAAVDEFALTVRGKGGHAAQPHRTLDPIPAGAALVTALQTLVSRERDPLEPLVVSVTQFHAGSATNVIAPEAVIKGTVRSYDAALRDRTERRIREIAAGVAAVHGLEIDVDYSRDYPATVNDPDRFAFAAEVAREIAGADAVDEATPPRMGAEDFSYMLEARPGAYLFLGQGDTPFCHHPAYDFNDAIAPVGASWFARLVERAQPAASA
ncbi:amidohydrolase [Rhodobacteraceae bacterium CCMM004]|nr:amidohydrolase [Rhodobacteraceae bacterium CCMM004]